MLIWNTKMEIKFKKLSPKASTPTYGTDGAAAFDLYASASVSGYARVIVKTDLVFEIPKGYAMLIKPRSGLAFKNQQHAFAGTIDSDYRGEVKVLLMNEYEERPLVVHAGDRVAQAIVIPVPSILFTEVGELSETSRGTNGFGSTD
jgi:dUTP pyrophosphatase